MNNIKNVIDSKRNEKRINDMYGDTITILNKPLKGLVKNYFKKIDDDVKNNCYDLLFYNDGKYTSFSITSDNGVYDIIVSHDLESTDINLNDYIETDLISGCDEYPSVVYNLSDYYLELYIDNGILNRYVGTRSDESTFTVTYCDYKKEWNKK